MFIKSEYDILSRDIKFFQTEIETMNIELFSKER